MIEIVCTIIIIIIIIFLIAVIFGAVNEHLIIMEHKEKGIDKEGAKREIKKFIQENMYLISQGVHEVSSMKLKAHMFFIGNPWGMGLSMKKREQIAKEIEKYEISFYRLRKRMIKDYGVSLTMKRIYNLYQMMVNRGDIYL